jgi:hypothetical protein
VKIELPAIPIDGYEIKWWEVDGDRVVEHRLLYHVDRTWRQVYPHAGAGADFHDEWQAFRNDHFTGRCDGWNLFRRGAWEGVFARGYATKEDALVELRKRLTSRLSRLREEAAEIEHRLSSEDLQ